MYLLWISNTKEDPTILNTENYCKVDGKNIELKYLKEAIEKLNTNDREDVYNQCKWLYENASNHNSIQPKLNSSNSIDVAYNVANITDAINKFFSWNSKNKTSMLAYKFIVKCIDNNFKYFEFNTSDYVEVRYTQIETDYQSAAPTPRLQPTPQSTNQVRCPKCGSTSITTEEAGYGLFGWIGASQKKNLCQKCGYKWWPGMK